MLTKDRLIRLCKARKHLRTVGHAELSIDAVAKTAGDVTLAAFADTCGNLIQIYQPASQ